jgi:hypothetical protein
MKLSLSSLALGAAIAAVPTVLVRIAVVGPVHVAGVPLAKDIVNINFATLPTPQPGSGKVTAYVVPSGRRLVLTGCTPNATGMLYSSRGQQHSPLLDLWALRTQGSYEFDIEFAGLSPFPVVVGEGSTLTIEWAPLSASMTLTGYLE